MMPLYNLILITLLSSALAHADAGCPGGTNWVPRGGLDESCTSLTSDQQLSAPDLGDGSSKNVEYGFPENHSCTEADLVNGCRDVWVNSNAVNNTHHGYNGCECPSVSESIVLPASDLNPTACISNPSEGRVCEVIQEKCFCYGHNPGH